MIEPDNFLDDEIDITNITQKIQEITENLMDVFFTNGVEKHIDKFEVKEFWYLYFSCLIAFTTETLVHYNRCARKNEKDGVKVISAALQHIYDQVEKQIKEKPNKH